MNRSPITPFALFCLLVFLTQLCSAQQKKYAPGEAIVKFSRISQIADVPSSRLLQTFSSYSHFEMISQRFHFEQMQPLAGNRSWGKPFVATFLIKMHSDVDVELAVAALQNLPEVEYAQPNYVYKMHDAPNDSLFPRQRALQVVKAEQAWDIQKASPDIIVGVIDTGIDYGHPDLADAIWINTAEDLNGNGRLDESDRNNIDDDGNGFIDDVIGWDFTDALSFPDGGDYLVPDNDPFDENGHGTAVSGIIGASGNNDIGIAGLAYGCRIMALRAGTARGFLEEDDVASAILYAIENGARIINMSFGDEAASPLLRDITAYAAAQNCLLVASSGNSGTDKIHYPSGFSSTLSVSATTPGDRLAPFSNYGSSVDIVAPGVNILTTLTGNDYGLFSGTSASAPFVSGLAALLFSKEPELSAQNARALIVSTADDLGAIGWDVFFANGRINAEEALASPFYAIAEITCPDVDAGFSEGVIDIRITASGAFVNASTLQIGTGETPNDWIDLFQKSGRQYFDEKVYSLQVDDLEDGIYTLRLQVYSQRQNTVEDRIRIFIDRTPPVISNVRQTPLMDADVPSALIEFETDELCEASIFFRALGSQSDFQEKALRFQTTQHRIHLTQDLRTALAEYYMVAENSAGLKTVENNAGTFFTIDLSGAPVGGIAIESLSEMLPSAFLLARTADFDDDDNLEVIINEYDRDFNFTMMKVLEFSGGVFDVRMQTSEVFIPRDWGDSDGDGKSEILAGRGASSFLFEANASGQYPEQIVWQNENAWASRFADLDQDGKSELILRIDNIFSVWETTGDNDFARVSTLVNPTDGSDAVGVPHSEIGDFDGDGRLEILLGDFDGDIYIHESVGDNQLNPTWSDRMPLLDAIDYLAVGDYDGDGIDEFAVGSRSNPDLNLESNFDSRHWIFRIYDRVADNSYAAVWQQGFFGFQEPIDFDSGVSSGDVDNDGLDEVLISVFPDFYVVDLDTLTDRYELIWHLREARSNATLVADFDRDNLNEFYLNTGTNVTGFRLLSEFGGPDTPTGLQAVVLDTTEIRLTWQFEQSADFFRIYRGRSPEGLAVLDSSLQNFFIDETAEKDTLYFYAITSVRQNLTPPEGRRTRPVSARPGARPFLRMANAIDASNLRVRFSEPMNHSVQNQTNYLISDRYVPSSAVIHKDGLEVLLSLPDMLQAGQHTVSIQNVFDRTGTLIDSTRNIGQFQVAQVVSPPYLVSAMAPSPTTVRLDFSEPLESASAENPGNYSIEPKIEIIAASLDPALRNIVHLEISSASSFGPLGKDYMVSVKNVISERGIQIEFGRSDRAALTFSSMDLANVFAYPNPYRADLGAGLITIAGLTAEATVRIMDVSGRLIRTIQEEDGNGGAQWDLKDERGELVASGIYIYYVVGNGEKATGKLAVVR